jgi:hypothetical protein
MWNAGAEYAPVICGALICFVLVNSEVILIIGNAAAIAIALCIFAVWCFVKERFWAAGVLCFAISLALKPHDTGLVWLYFLLAGGIYRKRALQTLLVVLLICLPAVLWVSHVAPNWMQELHANLLETSARGDLNDPGPSSMGAHTLGMMINLQTVMSVFRDSPRFYNLATYLVCGPLLLVWIFVTLRSRFSPTRVWLALAAISALSMLPVYHRQYDTKLLLLTVPACAMLWSERGLIGWLALLVNTATFVVTGDIPWAILLILLGKLHLSMTGLSRQIVMAVLIFPPPLIILVMGAFYLWVYVRRCSQDAATPTPAEA